MRRTALRCWRRRAEIVGQSWPSGVMPPMPVMTTRFIAELLGWRAWARQVVLWQYAAADESWTSVSSACRRASYFSLRAQREVTKRNGTPRTRPPGILPCGCAGGFRGFSAARPVLSKNWPTSCRPPCGLVLHPPAASEGPRVERRASCAHSGRRCATKERECAVLVLVLLLEL